MKRSIKRFYSPNDGACLNALISPMGFRTYFCFICSSLLASCFNNKIPEETHVARIPNTGLLSTNVILPDSMYVSLVIGYPNRQNETINGTLTLIGNTTTNSFAIGKDSEETNWLKNYGLDSIIAARMLTGNEEKGGLGLQRGGQYKLVLIMTNIPNESHLYFHYLE